MKRSTFFIIIALLVCCTVPDKPKDVADHFIKASLRLDFKEAKKYATPETAKLLDFVQSIAAKTKVDSNSMKDMKIEFGVTTITGDDATVKYKKEGDAEEYTLNLKKINDKWLVDAGMNDFSKGNDAEAGEMEGDREGDKDSVKTK